MSSHAAREVSRFIEPILEDMGFELVDVEYLSEGGRWILRIYADREGGITLDDCAGISREISDLLDIKDIFTQPYVLEVSSPGLNRPLRKERDFVNAIGENVKIRMASRLAGRRNFKGRLHSFRDGILGLNVNHEVFLLPYHGVEKANIIYDFGE